MGRGHEGGLSGRVVTRIGVFLEVRGHDSRAFFAEHGLALEALDSADARVPYALVTAMGLRAAELTGVANVGLELAMTVVEPATLDVAGWMLMASASVRRGLERAERYQRYWGDGERMQIVPVPGGLALRYSHPSAAPPSAAHEARHQDECALAEVVLGLRFMTGRDDVGGRLVRFRHPAPADTTQHERIFRSPIEFEAAHTELELADATLELPMKNAHELYCAMFEREVERALAALPETQRVAVEVRTIARAALLADGCTLAGVARALGTSPRTLQRRLHAEGTSFDAILDAVRRELAQSFLERGVPLKQIAMLLGYAETSAFHRAFKRWTGESPRSLLEADGAKSQRTGASSQ